MNEIFFSFCRVFADDMEFLTHLFTKTLMQQRKTYFEIQYPEYQISSLLEESLSMK